MFTVSPTQQVDPEIVKEAIKYNELSRNRYNKLEQYYLGTHEILNRKKNELQSNNKVVVNHAKYITDINTGYLLGNPVEYQSEMDIEPVLEQYKEQTIADLDNEIAKDISIFGKQYELVYATDMNEVKSKDIDVRNCIIAYDDTVEHNKMFAVAYELGERKDTYKKVVVYDKNFIYDMTIGDKIGVSKITQHFFGDVPMVEYRNNSEEIGDFEQVIPLIDAYNTVQSDRVNDKEQLVSAILAFYGVDMTPEQKDDLYEYRTLSGIPADAKIEYITKQLNEQDADTLRSVLEQDIHKVSMTPNMSDQNFIGNSSGVAIKYKLLPFEQSISNKERYFEKGLLRRFELYNNYLNMLGKMEVIPTYEIDAIFKRNLPQNDFETSQMITNLRDLVDEETLLGELSFVKNAQEILEKKDEERAEKANVEARRFGEQQQVVDTAGQEAQQVVDKSDQSLMQKLSNLLRGE